MMRKRFCGQKKFLYIFSILIFDLILISFFLNFKITNFESFEKDSTSSIRISSNGPPNKEYFETFKVITIEHEMVSGSGSYTNFPVLISISDPDLHNDTQPSGNDIAFANTSSWLDHEIEHYEQSYNSTHAQLIAWVRIPTLSTSTDTFIFMYYGNSTMGPQENPAGVWENSFKGVWHLKEDPGPGNVGDIKDSTSNDNDGTAAGVMETADQISAQIDGGINFDGSGDYIDMGNIGTGIKSISFWMKPDAIQSIIYENTGFKSPSATGNPNNEWTNPTNAYASDNQYTTTSVVGARQDYQNFNLGVPNDVTIEGIEISIEGKGIGSQVNIRLSWNGGTSYTSGFQGQKSVSLDPLENPISVGGSSDKWGRSSWDPSEFSNGNFRVRIEKGSMGMGDPDVDHIRARVYYSYPDNMSVLCLDATHQIIINKDTSEINALNFAGTTTIYVNGSVGSNVEIGKWHHVTITNNAGVDATAFDIGRILTFYFDGSIDEVHLTETLRTQGWITTEYNNQYDPDSFCSIGEEDSVDQIPPYYSNLIESSNPLELGDTEVVSINVTDPSGVNQVLIEFEGSNHSMTNIGGDTWCYDSWTPNSAGNYSYTIYMEDYFHNWNSTAGLIMVVDTTPPVYSNLIESADPLKFGQNETISIKVFDSPGTGVNQVLLEYDFTNHTMIFIGADTWSWDNWKPSIDGFHSYKIFMQDNQNNWNTTSGTITVVTTTAPIIENLTESTDPLELGNNITFTIDVFDNETSVHTVFIELEGVNHTMGYAGGNSYEFSWCGSSVGTINYKIYANDTGNNWNSLTSSFEIVDTIPPSFSNLIESEDPIELGNTVLITINSSDISDINQVKIEFEGTNHTMTNIGGNTWQYSQWSPSTTGLFNYTIWSEDNNLNWNKTSGSIQVQDTTLPIYSDLTESSDPIELGLPLLISINVSDIAGIKQVLIEFENSNHTMALIGGNIWQYDSWMPTSVGNYSYTIYMKDNNDNLNFVSDIMTFQDTISPLYSNLIIISDPLELGNSVVFTIQINDFAGINRSLLEFEGLNHSMTNLYGDIWEFHSWTPDNISTYHYIIHMEDMSGNWNTTYGTITVQDTLSPSPPIITIAPSGDVNGILTFDWTDGFDPSGISYYILIIDNESDPLNTPGYVFEFNITNTGPESSYFELSENLDEGRYYYFLIQVDGEGHQSNYTSGTFNVITINTESPINEKLIYIIVGIIIASVVGLIATTLIVRKRIKKEILPQRKKISLKMIISHLNELSSIKIPGKKEQSLANNELSDEKKLKIRIKEIKNRGGELFAEGAYLEAQKEFELGRNILLNLGRQEEAKLFTELISGIEGLEIERDKRLEILGQSVIEGNSTQVFDLYQDIIEISKKLRDPDTKSFYQYELIQYFQKNESNLLELERYRFELKQKADSLFNNKSFKMAMQLYEKCEKISILLVQLEREEEVANIEEFRNKKNECLKKVNN